MRDFLEYFLYGCAIVHSDLDPIVKPHKPDFAEAVPTSTINDNKKNVARSKINIPDTAINKGELCKKRLIDQSAKCKTKSDK